ncbi:unnamed protein product [Adineta steineri]|uniref:Uncharacterized protein n=1 Tax=Adineta steineri TaxID=433720 RepID=A0A819GPD4_9BILA|nr:unnamed protein product [Adineta steineri]CAF3884997.1 unnamed protein product [Adineta steineri]
MKSVIDSKTPLFANEFVTCYSDYLIIHLYYFPFGNKKIKYNNIRLCELRLTDDISLLNYKLWGMALTPIWWHCDMSRLGRKYYILLDANQWPLIGITMNDNDIEYVYNLIKQKIYSNQSQIYNEKLPYDSAKVDQEKKVQYQ